ncbi:fatty acid desaturase [Caldalkalibacillus thermarum TA2.A1]|uniref:Acyl-CoA desaturase n=1 Tax=Caldalkalibacillus thermarum (strain TA2.A1) TaxID=986075 RepID=F5L8H9_CALTT|nr:acyl-CoA desaturase [Caldalkalibacillus thermarum]EGL82318.1 fatty acid desaturase [Caldalkalibacillus thermarum TA2.A1]QZT32883.1 acyl-CoA desaturase [Caldalkalibacillus thermarum TA2.A1]
MKELRSYGWYAARISPFLPPEAFQPVPGRLWGGAAYFLLIISGIVLITVGNFSWWIHFIVSCVLGFSFAGIGFLGHEILHGAVVRRPWLRNLLGAIALWPLCTGPILWRKWHNIEHHVHTQHEETDPDAWASLEQFYQRRYLKWVYKLPLWFRSTISFTFFTLTFTIHSLRMFFRYVREFKLKARLKVILQFVLPWATWIGLLLLIGFEKWLFAYLIPLLIANFIVIAYISTNHRLNPLVPVNDPLANTLTVTVPKWVDLLHFNFSHHTEHHLFPAMSSKYYPLVKEHIKKMWPDRYHEMPMVKALLTLWKTPRLYYNAKGLIDPYRGHVYGSLGNGLDPDQIKMKKVR